MHRHSYVLTALAAASGLCAPGFAHAATETSVHYQNASGFCQPALPVFDGNIRKRPTAVANEGTSNAFVSCSMATLPEEGAGVTDLQLAIYNRTAADIDVTCSLVHGFAAGSLIVPKTRTVPANEREFFAWTLADIGDPASGTFDFANFSCNLPVGTDVGYGFYYYDYEIGT